MDRRIMKKLLNIVCIFLCLWLPSAGQVKTANDGVYGTGGALYQNRKIGGAFYANDFNNLLGIKPVRTYLVKNAGELRAALQKAKKNELVYLDEGGNFDLTGQNLLPLNDGVIMASGLKGKKGAKIYVNSVKNSQPIFRLKGTDVKIVGIQFQGPDTGVFNHQDKTISQEKSNKLKARAKKEGVYYSTLSKMYAQPEIRCIWADNQGKTITFEVRDCEFYGWTLAAIAISKNVVGKIHNNYIHDNKHYGLGYGIVISGGKAIISGNYFNNNRHSIASNGMPGSQYEACYNIVGENGTAHAFDMHGGKDRKDGTNVAGTKISIHHNEFRIKGEAIVIRGIPKERSYINNNLFINEDISSAFLQRNAKGNISFYNNKFVAGNKSWIEKGKK